MRHPRNVRAARARDEEPTCRVCRRTAKAPDEATMDKMRRWWLERYSLDELLETFDAGAIDAES
jgi:hypothetical protein